MKHFVISESIGSFGKRRTPTNITSHKRKSLAQEIHINSDRESKKVCQLRKCILLLAKKNGSVQKNIWLGINKIRQDGHNGWSPIQVRKSARLAGVFQVCPVTAAFVLVAVVCLAEISLFCFDRSVVTVVFLQRSISVTPPSPPSRFSTLSQFLRISYFEFNKTGTRQCTRAVWSAFADFHTTHPGALMHYLGSLEFTVRIFDASDITTHTRPT